MGDTDHIAPLEVAPSVVPRFVENLNGFAERVGLSTRVYCAPYSNDPEVRLWGEWRGTRAQLVALGWLTPSQHLVLAKGTLTFPGGAVPSQHPIATGQIEIDGDAICYTFDCGPLPVSARTHGAAQIISYADELLYHGDRDALVVAGVEIERIACGKRSLRRGGHWNSEFAKWTCRRQPDGLFVYRVETEAARQRRCEHYKSLVSSLRPAGAAAKPARPTHLKLVVNNERREEPQP